MSIDFSVKFLKMRYLSNYTIFPYFLSPSYIIMCITNKSSRYKINGTKLKLLCENNYIVCVCVCICMFEM